MAQKAVEEITTAGGEALFVKTDASKEEDVKLFTLSAAADVGRFGIRVVSVAPGTIETPMVQAALEDEDDARMIRNNHMRKQVLKAEDMANVVYFLSTEESTIINGCDVSVYDGFAHFKDWRVIE